MQQEIDPAESAELVLSTSPSCRLIWCVVLFDDATATHSPVLQVENSFCVIILKVNETVH